MSEFRLNISARDEEYQEIENSIIEKLKIYLPDKTVDIRSRVAR
jgi:hypothetical protein